jgi:hypothetical protein
MDLLAGNSFPLVIEHALPFARAALVMLVTLVFRLGNWFVREGTCAAATVSGHKRPGVTVPGHAGSSGMGRGDDHALRRVGSVSAEGIAPDPPRAPDGGCTIIRASSRGLTPSRRRLSAHASLVQPVDRRPLAAARPSALHSPHTHGRCAGPRRAPEGSRRMCRAPMFLATWVEPQDGRRRPQDTCAVAALMVAGWRGNRAKAVG